MIMEDKKRSNRYCSVPQCTSRPTKIISLHYFPKEKTIQNEWSRILCIRKPISSYMNVCSLHFKNDDFFFPDASGGKRYLKKGSVPSQNLPCDSSMYGGSFVDLGGSKFFIMNLRNMTSINSPHYSSNYGNDEYDFEDDNDEIEEDGDADQDESDEDTEEASETENRKIEPSLEVTDIKEQIYLEKLNNLKSQLQQLVDGTYPDYLRKVKKLELQYKERLRLNQIWREHQIEITEKDFVAEKKAATKELEEKVVELKENLIQDMEEKRKLIEAERVSMELSGDSTESKPAMTRKLRRRPNDPAPIPEKRRGKLASLPSNINFLLDDKEIEADLKAISRGIKPGASVRKPANGLQSLGPIIPDSTSSADIRIEDGKLLYDRKWFHRGQTVFVEGKELPKFPAIISAIGSEAISVKKTVDATKIRIYIRELIRGKVTIKRRAS